MKFRNFSKVLPVKGRLVLFNTTDDQYEFRVGELDVFEDTLTILCTDTSTCSYPIDSCYRWAYIDISEALDK